MVIPVSGTAVGLDNKFNHTVAGILRIFSALSVVLYSLCSNAFSPLNGESPKRLYWL